MKKFILAAVAAMTIGFGAISAQADDAGFYAGAQTGIYNINQNSGAWSGSDKTFGGAIIGGYDTGMNISGETRLGATDKAKYNMGGTPVEVQLDYAFSYLLKPYTDMSTPYGMVKAYGLLGATTARIANTAAGVTTKNTVTGVSYGLGASINMADNMDIGAEWFRALSNKTTGVNQNITVDAFTVNGVYHF